LACAVALLTATNRIVGRCADLANRFGIRGVVLLPLHERLHVSRRNQTDDMAQSSKLTCPVMGAAAGLHRHYTRGLAGEERQNFLASQPLTEDNLAGRIRAVRLKDVLRQV
jgi:hypothetical protein